MTRWTLFPHASANAHRYDPATLTEHWARLHAGDAEPLPHDRRVLTAWALFHAGHFEEAVETGLQAQGAGVTAANKAQVVYATYLEPSEETRLALFWQVAERAEAQMASNPANPNAHFLMAYALGRYGQGISISKALSKGLPLKIRTALETAVRLAPQHADAHAALGAFHAEVIDKVGALLGRSLGASKDAGMASFKTALKLNPNSALAMVEYANGLVMLEGEKHMLEATRLYERAAACVALDASEQLAIDMAKAQLAAD